MHAVRKLSKEAIEQIDKQVQAAAAAGEPLSTSEVGDLYQSALEAEQVPSNPLASFLDGAARSLAPGPDEPRGLDEVFDGMLGRARTTASSRARAVVK